MNAALDGINLISFAPTNYTSDAPALTVIYSFTEAGTLLSNALIVEARDPSGNPVPGIGVTFSADGGGASVSVTNVRTTGADGRVQVRGTLGAQAGSQTFTASPKLFPSARIPCRIQVGRA